MAEEVKSNENQVPPQIPFHYANGFELGTTLSDISIVLLIDGQPHSKLSMSFTTAKTLAVQLDKAVRMFEDATGQKLLTMEDVQKSMAKPNENK